MKKVGVINCGISNLTSVVNAFKSLSIEVEVIEKATDMNGFSHLILPGVGSFPRGIENLRNHGFEDEIKENVEKNVPLLGICLGMQLLCDQGEEFGITRGLGLIPGDVTKIQFNASEVLPLPHVGWNEASYLNDSVLYRSIPENSTFYFVHSYAYAHESDEYITGQCQYGNKLPCSIESGNVFGVQFHPEKSQKSGLQLLKNFVELC